MKETAETRLARAVPKAVLTIVSVLLFGAGSAQAGYLTDGTKQTAPGVYQNPQDGVCVVGLGVNGTANAGVLDVDKTITNAQDCLVKTTIGIKALGNTACIGGAGNDGYKHAWSTNVCVDGSGNPISRVNLDRSPANTCTELGGTVSAGICVAYGWVYMNTTPAEIPYRNTIPPSGYKGRVSTENFGFCYAAMRMTTAPGYSTATGCPSVHNDSVNAAAGEWVTSLSDGVKYQTQTSYDAGLGWSFASSQCVYAYGTKGTTNALLTKADNTTVAIGTVLDFTGVTTQGDCLAAGGAWDNWLPYGDGTGLNGNASTLSVPTTGAASSIVKLDATTAILAGGGNYYSGTGSVCQKCHSDQSRGYMERNKPGFPLTKHKLAGDNTLIQTAIDPWGVKGVQCTICHATGKPTAQDLGTIVYPNTTGTNAGLPRAASGHNQTEYGSHLTGVCYKCHGIPAGSVTDPLSPNPATVIPTSSGEFTKTAFQVAPIVNQFLASPHAKYSGTSRTVDVITKTNYGSSTFKGYTCRSSATLATTGAMTATFGVLTPASMNGFVVGGTVTVVGAGVSGALLTATVSSVGTTTVTLSPTASTTVTASAVSILNSFGAGSILTTWVNKGVPAKIPNLDSATNIYCTGSPIPLADKTAYAGGFWVADGEVASVVNGVNVASSDQGNCMTCHDVHWSKDDASPDAEPFRRECTTCHANPGTSASSAPQFNTSVIKHPSGAGTPLAGTADAACEKCHMPTLTGAGSKMHLWSISTNAAYSTAGASKANLDGSDIKVDLNAACGQCHNSAGSAHLFDNTALAAKAGGMHTAGTWPSGAYPAACVACHQSAGDAAAQQIKPYNWGLPPSDPSNSGANHHALVDFGYPGGNFTCNNGECHGKASNFSGVTNAAARNGGGVKVIDITQPNTTAGCLECHVNSGPYAIHHATTNQAAACTSCHGTYGGVYAVASFGATTNAQCLQCHSVQIGSNPIISMANLKHPSSAATPSNCVQCHSAEPLVAPFNAASPSFAGCLSCHQGPSPVGPAFTNAQLTTYATGMHIAPGGGATAAFVATNDSLNPLKINVDASSSVCPPSQTCTYSWNWGDATANGSGKTTNHMYAAPGNKVITLTLTASGGAGASTSQRVTAYAADLKPVAAVTSCALVAGTWKVSCTNASTDDIGVTQIVFNWGDGSVITSVMGAPYVAGGTYEHTYAVPPTGLRSYAVTLKAYDTKGQTATVNPLNITGANLAYGTLTGTVKTSVAPIVPISGVQILVKNANNIGVASANSALDGSFSLSLKPGSYTLVPTKAGYSFGTVPITITSGANSVAITN